MNDLDRDIAGAVRAHVAVIAALRDLSDDQVRQPSVLPGWTVGHVATHIARNAEGHMRMLEAASRGEVGAMYPGGREQRTQRHRGRVGAHRARNWPPTSRPRRQPSRPCGRACRVSAWSGRGDMVGGDDDHERPSVHPLARGRRAPLRSRRRLHLGRLGPRVREARAGAADDAVGQSQADGHDRAAASRRWQSAPHHRVAWLLGRTEIEGLAPAGIIN